MRKGVYEPIEPDIQGRLCSQLLGLVLVRWEGSYQDVHIQWLRWATLEGTLLPTPQEVAAQEQRRADAAQQRTIELEAVLARYRERFGDPPA